MEVSWVFEPNPDGTITVRIIHDFSKGIPIPALDAFVSEQVVGNFFTHNVAGKTLAMVKLLAEADRMAHAGVTLRREEDLGLELPAPGTV
jgi:hypothetical protein